MDVSVVIQIHQEVRVGIAKQVVLVTADGPERWSRDEVNVSIGSSTFFDHVACLLAVIRIGATF